MAAPNATQNFVPVKEVRNGVILLKNGEYRGILMCSSTNFALKSEDEQRGIIGGFQNLLNTLDFSIEIVVHSRKMDLRPYLSLLAERESAQATELMKIQVREYVQFVKSFSDAANIMTKMFYVIVPYTPPVLGAVKNSLSFLSRNTPAAPQGLTSSFDEHRIQLEQRMSLVASGLAGSGIRAAALGTEEVIELLYRSFNLGQDENPIRAAATGPMGERRTQDYQQM
jgi:hypothetical protein